MHKQVTSAAQEEMRTKGSFLPFIDAFTFDIVTATFKLKEGWGSLENRYDLPARWMASRASVIVPPERAPSYFLLTYDGRELDKNKRLTIKGACGQVTVTLNRGRDIVVIDRRSVAPATEATVEFQVSDIVDGKLSSGSLLVHEFGTTAAFSSCPDGQRIGSVLKTRDDLDRYVGLAHHMAAHSNDALSHLFSRVYFQFPAPPNDPSSTEYQLFWEDQYRRIRGHDYDTAYEAHAFSEERMRDVFPYCTKSGNLIGNQLIAIGNMLKALEASRVQSGASILEMGVGWGNTAFQLALCGFQMTVLDIEEKYLRLVKSRFEREGLPVNIVHGDFFSVERLRKCFDVVLFYECFHHCLYHRDLIKLLATKLRPGGLIVFAGETITRQLPYPWGLNNTGEGIWSICHHGWMELCFREDYFVGMLSEFGFEVERYDCPQTPAGIVYTAQLNERSKT